MDLKTDQDKWKVSVDESYEALKKFGDAISWGLAKKEKWRYYEIRGRYGMVYPYSASHLCAHFSSIRLFKQKADKPGWKKFREGDSEGDYLILNRDLEIAASAIRAYRKRHLSIEHLKKLKNGWQRVKTGSFSSSSGEILIPVRQGNEAKVS